MNLSQFSIRDLEQLSGIKAHTLRIWEKRYGLFRPERSPANIRSFSDEDLKKVLNISILNRNGLKISHIVNLSNREIQQRVISMNPDPFVSSARIEALMVSLMEFDEDHFNRILSKSILTLGMESTFMQLIFPFMRRIGILWQTGSINPAQEHFMTNLIRQKLISGIAHLNPNPKTQGKRIVVFLPEGELHELGILFTTYLLKQWGHHVLYLGTMTPVESVVASLDIWPADVLLTSLTSTLSTCEDPEDFIRGIATAFKNKTVIISGPEVNHLNKIPHSNIIYMDDMNELKKMFHSLDFSHSRK